VHCSLALWLVLVTLLFRAVLLNELRLLLLIIVVVYSVVTVER